MRVERIDEKPFGSLAIEYDRLNVANPCIRYIREQFRKKILDVIPRSDRIHCLDIGCGTGEDALFFAKRGWQVIGIDESSAMLQLASSKAGDELSPSVDFLVQDFNELATATFRENQFDVAFSNFGALNCVTDLTSFAHQLNHFIKPGGILALNVLGKFYPVEILSFGLRGNWSVAVRRLRKKPTARVGADIINVAYWSPKRFIPIFKASDFELLFYSAIAWLVPAPYFFDGRPGANLPGFLTKLDSAWGKTFPFNHWGDHTFYFFRKV